MPPLNPYIIYGTVTINGVVQEELIVTITNLTAGGSGTTTTDASGNYIYDDLSQLSLGYTSGDSIQVSVSGASKIFTSAEPEEKLINFIFITQSLSDTVSISDSTTQLISSLQQSIYDLTLISESLTNSVELTQLLYDNINIYESVTVSKQRGILKWWTGTEWMKVTYI